MTGQSQFALEHEGGQSRSVQTENEAVKNFY